MPRRAKNEFVEASRVWFLREWMETLGKIQRDLVTGLGLSQSTAFKLWHGFQAPSAEHIIDVANFLNVTPFELLMPPEEAMRVRRLKQALAEVAGDSPAPPQTRPEPKTGTAG